MATSEELRAYLYEWVRDQRPIFARIDNEITGTPRISYCGRLNIPPGNGPDSTYFIFSLVDPTSVRGFDFNIQAAAFAATHAAFGKAVELEWKQESMTGPGRALRVILSEQSPV